MHEAALARHLLALVLKRAALEGTSGVQAVVGWVADAEDVSLERLQSAFEAGAVGTAAEGAVLQMRLIRVNAVCARCCLAYGPQLSLLICPRCGCTEGRLLGTTGMGVESLQVSSVVT